MHGEIRAVIDVGTNSVKFLVATVDGKVVRPLDEGSEQTRLGQGFYETHLLQPAAIRQTSIAVAQFAEKLREWNPAKIRVIATSAARDATNGHELIQAIRDRSGLQAEVITGEQEAEWAFQGVVSDPALADHPVLVIDIGGGSTEFTAGRSGHRDFGHSFKLGTVRLLEHLPVDDPPGPGQLEAHVRHVTGVLDAEVKPALAPALQKLGSVHFVGTGGTTTILARIHLCLRSFNRELIDGAVLSQAQVSDTLNRLWSLPIESRRAIIGLPSNRADVILPGVAIVHQVMQSLDLPSIRISTRGLRFAALMDS